MQDVFCLFGRGGVLPNGQYVQMAPNRIKELAPSDLIEAVGDGDKKLVEAFHQADPAMQAAVVRLLGMEAGEYSKQPVSSRQKSFSKPK